MNGARSRVPDLLVWSGGCLALAATTAAMHLRSSAAVSDPADVTWPTQVALALDVVGPSVVAGLLLLLLHRSGHPRTARLIACAWVLGQALTSMLGLDPWAAAVARWDDPSPGLVATLAVTAARAVLCLLPLLLAGPGLPAPDGARRAHALAARLGVGLGTLTVAGTLGWVASGDDWTVVDDDRWLLAVLLVTVAATLTATWTTTARLPHAATAVQLVVAVLAWRGVPAGLDGPDGSTTVRDDVVRLAAAGAGALVAWTVAQSAPAWRDAATSALPATPFPELQGARHARPPARVLVAAAAALALLTAGVGWQAHLRSPSVSRATLAQARADAEALDPAALGPGWREDLTGTACGDGAWAWCGTTADSPAEAAGVLRAAMRGAGWSVGEVSCGERRGFDLTSMVDWTPGCRARAHRGDVVVTVLTGDTVRPPVGDDPARPSTVRQRATSAMVGAWRAHDDPDWTTRTPDPGGIGRVAALTAALTPAGWTASTACGARGADDTVPTSDACPAGRTLTLTLRAPAPAGGTASGAAGAAAVSATAAVRDRLLDAGFLVEAATCAPGPDAMPDEKDRCRVLARRWTLPGRRGGRLVLGHVTVRDGAPEAVLVVGVS
ncbi:MAG: hypothetical protein U0Q15_02045 [Kineosporiaceae bacterium]